MKFNFIAAIKKSFMNLYCHLKYLYLKKVAIIAIDLMYCITIIKINFFFNRLQYFLLKCHFIQFFAFS